MTSYAIPEKGKKSMKARKRTYLVGRPVSFHNSPIGRCTRGYVAWDVEQGDKCFLKDQWRPYTRNATPEWKIYQRLYDRGVAHIATCIAGGDVGPRGRAQQTITQTYINNLKPEGRNKSLVPRVHCRLVTKEIGRSLETYTNSEELFTACSHALIGTLSHCPLSVLSTHSA